MKVLFVSAILPYPLYSGGQVRLYNLLKRLSVNHEITLVCFYRKKSELIYIPKLDFLKVIPVYRGSRLRFPYLVKFFLGKSLLLSSYDNEIMRQTISDEIAGGGYDLVHAEPFYVTPSIPEIPIPLVVAEHNVEYQVYQDYADTSKFPLLKYLLNQETERIKMAEYSALNYAGHVIAVSPEDKSAFCKITGKENISIIPNGVDIEYFRYQERGKQTDPVFLFVGSFKWLPNREVLKRLINDIWPEVRLKIPRATLRVVGRDIPAGIKSGSYPGVVFADNVTDIRIEYAKAAALISPVQIPGGSKYKILESMAAGLPVVTTVAGLSGINAQNRIHALTVESDREFPGALVKLLQSPEECRKMTKNARDLIEADYSWIKIAQKLEKVWQQIIK